jgi:syntaxin 5
VHARILTQNMKASKDRSEQFVSGAIQSATPPPSIALSGRRANVVLSSSSPLYNPITRPHSAQPYTKSSPARPTRGDLLSLNMDQEEASVGISPQSQQMQLVHQQDQYLAERGQAIESIESTIHELGSIFQQLAQMVSEQAETVQRYDVFSNVTDRRIDANTDDIVTNVGGAQRELLKYYARVTSNRWLMIKIFGVLIIFFLLWVLVS